MAKTKQSAPVTGTSRATAVPVVSGSRQIANKPKRTRVLYSMEQIEKGLSALILSGGSVHNAVKLLAADPTVTRVPPRSTLGQWPEQHPKRYEELQEQLAERLAKRAAAGAEALVVRLTALQMEAVDEAHNIIDAARDAREDPEALPEHRVVNSRALQEISGAARNWATAAGIGFNQVSATVRARPTTITVALDPRMEFLQVARSHGIVIEGTAEELPPAPEPPE